MSLAIVPGSFDPMTLGHLDIVKTVAARYDDVVVAVMVNPAKRYRYTMGERVRIAIATVAELPNVRVIAERGMLIDLFDRLGADAVCKGWRDEKDYAYEREMAEWNLAHNPRFHTELLKLYLHPFLFSPAQPQSVMPHLLYESRIVLFLFHFYRKPLPTRPAHTKYQALQFHTRF